MEFEGFIYYELLEKKLRDLRVEEAIFDWLDEGKREIGEDLVREISEKFDINLELAVSLCFRYIGFDTPRTPIRERRRKYESGLFVHLFCKLHGNVS